MKFILLISISFHIIEADEGAAVLSLCRNSHSSARIRRDVCRTKDYAG